MRKLIILTLTIVVFSFNSKAQVVNTPAPEPTASSEVVTVINLDGKVKYAEPDSKKFKKLKEGAILDTKGTVKLKKKAELTVLNNGKMQTLNTKGKHALNSMTASGSSIEDDFFAFLNDASGFGGPGGGGKKDSTAHGGSGHGKGEAFKGKSPIGGKVPAKTVSFSWDSPIVSDYTLNIYRASDPSKPVFSKNVNAKNMIVDIKDIEGIKTGDNYYWQVEQTVEGITKKTKQIDISFVEPSEGMEILNHLESTDAFKKSSGWQKALRSAVVLQRNKLYYEADQKYRQAMIDFPKNELVKSSYEMFLSDTTKNK